VILVVLGGLGWGGKLVWKQVSPGLFGTKRVDKIPTAKVKNATIAEEITAVGRLRAVFSTELRSEINGRIVKIAAVDGQRVERDQEILRLDQQDILTQLQEIERTMEASRLKAQRARRDFERSTDLQKQGLVAPKDFEDARVALSLAIVIGLVGVWAAARPEDPAQRVAERKKLIARREKLFQDLVRLEHDHRRGRIDEERYASRREDLLASLELVYGALDGDDTSPEPGERRAVGASFDSSTPPGSSRAASRDDQLRAS